MQADLLVQLVPRSLCLFLAMLLLMMPGVDVLADKYDEIVDQVREQTMRQEIEQAGIDDLVARAERGEVWASNRLGYNYYYGKNAPRDFKEAYRWYSRAAESGSAGGQYAVGLMNSNGDGMVRNPQLAHQWFLKAAEQGDVGAQRMLGNQFENGTGVPKNRVQAALWYTRAAEQGNVQAQFETGLFFYNCSIPKEVTKVYHGDQITFGFNMEKKTSDQLDAEYKAAHPELKLKVRGPDWDYDKAYVWLTIAAENGHHNASNFLEPLNTMFEPADFPRLKQLIAEQKQINSNKAVVKAE